MINQAERQDILAYLLGLHAMQAHKKGQDFPLVFNNDVEPAMRKACKHDANTDVIQFS